MLEKIVFPPHGKVSLCTENCCGSDAQIITRAVISYGKDTISRDKQEFISFLYKNKHLSPFESVVITYLMTAPIFVVRQIVRHRTHSMNEVSGRYTEHNGTFYIPDNVADDIAEAINRHSELSLRMYSYLISNGTPKQTARMVLPLNMYTTFYWQMNLRNLFNFWDQRVDKHAQYETRKYAEAMLELVRVIAPLSINAYWENRNAD